MKNDFTLARAAAILDRAADMPADVAETLREHVKERCVEAALAAWAEWHIPSGYPHMRKIAAKYHGTCKVCGEHIWPSERIEYDFKHKLAFHFDCARHLSACPTYRRRGIVTKRY